MIESHNDNAFVVSDNVLTSLIVVPLTARTNVIGDITYLVAGGDFFIYGFSSRMNVILNRLDYEFANRTNLRGMLGSLCSGNMRRFIGYLCATSTFVPVSGFIYAPSRRVTVSVRLLFCAGVAVSAMNASERSKSVFGTSGSFNAANDIFVFKLGNNFVGQFVRASRTHLGYNAVFDTIRRFFRRYVIVSVSGKLYVSAKNGVTYRAFNSRGITYGSTSGINVGKSLVGMSLRQNDNG